ncbi:hypothetical protein [Robiginitalea sp. SC105]|uniref:hypothetical protein n=1 Tax=Robiginitalea sp. SC105 TaxID=2762332 RepID=UPI00163A7D1F|nr:hypothetical protein [Robiginitalea sp. SC105]MBC2840402.1 hypothetical protein [Robiginitalea sp. SC105]
MKLNLKLLIPGSLLCVTLMACSSNGDDPTDDTITGPTKPVIAVDKKETFTITSDGVSWEAKIWIPSEYETNKNLPAIYLIDFKEQHHVIATDEFDKVIEGVKAVSGFNALVITLAEHLDVDFVIPKDYQEFNKVFQNIAAYVDAHYTTNTSRTFIGRGSESSMVLMALFIEEQESSIFQNFIATDSPSIVYFTELLENENFPQIKDNKKLHYSLTSDSEYDLNSDFIAALNEKAYPWLEFEIVEYLNFDYENAYPKVFADGIRYIFEE